MPDAEHAVDRASGAGWELRRPGHPNHIDRSGLELLPHRPKAPERPDRSPGVTGGGESTHVTSLSALER